MAHNIETIFYTREAPWHGLGVKVAESPDSKEALKAAGLDWNVIQEPIYTGAQESIEGYKANIRDSDRKALGVVTNRYKVVQNRDAFAFTDSLLGKGVRYETAGSLQGGRRVWPVRDYIEILLPQEDGATPQQTKNVKRLQEDMARRYFDAPDLQDVGKNAYRFINAVSDFATHAEPIRRTKNYKENLFSKTVDGNPLIDRAYQMVCSAA